VRLVITLVPRLWLNPRPNAAAGSHALTCMAERPTAYTSELPKPFPNYVTLMRPKTGHVKGYPAFGSLIP